MIQKDLIDSINSLANNVLYVNTMNSHRLTVFHVHNF